MRLLRLLEHAVVDRGGAILAGLIAVTLFFGAGYARLEWTPDPEVITLQGSDSLEHYREFVRRWGSDEIIVLGYDVDDAFAPDRLEQLRDLTDALLDVDHVLSVSSLDTAFTVDTGPFGPYPRSLVPDEIGDTRGVRRDALASRFVRNALVTDDARTLLVAVQLEGSELDNATVERAAVEGIEAVLAREPFRGLDAQIVGSPIFNRELQRLNQRDNAFFTPLVLVVTAVLLWVLFRGLLPTALALGVVGASLLWTMGLMGWLGIPLNITTSLLPPLLMVIAVADSVHILSGYVGRLGSGASRRDAVGWTIREIVPACFWTSATTALGFASLLLVRIESVRTFGVFAVLGVVIAFLHAILLLPAAMTRLPLERVALRGGRPRVLDLCARAARRPALALAVLGGALVLGAVGLPRIEVATHDGEFFRAANPVNRAYRFLEARVGGVTPFEVELRASTPGALHSATAIAGIRALQDRMEEIPELTATTSIVDLLLATSPKIDLSDERALERSLFLLATLAPEETRQWIREGGRLGRVSGRAMAMTSARSEEIIAGLQREASRLFADGVDVRFTGLVPIFAQMEQYLVEGQVRSYGFAAVAIGAAFLLLFRSLAMTLLAILANLVPVAIAAGIMGLGGIRLDVGTIMVASVALGIIVDDTIHLVQSFRRGLELHGDAAAALDHALGIAGRPVLLTSAILVGGFGVLTLSDFQPTAHFGLLVAVAVAGALVGDLVVLPATLLWLGAPSRPRTASAVLLVLASLALGSASRVSADGSGVGIEVGAFSSASGELPLGWEPMEFPRIPRHTAYRPVLDGGSWVVRADSDASASGLIRSLRIDLREYPVLRWRWKVERSLDRGDVRSKAGDDYAARIYVAFEYDPDRVGLWKRVKYRAARALYGDLPIGALNYIWASREPVGSIVDNPYAGSFVKMVVVQSGPSRAGQWFTEERNVYEDFKKGFGEEPPPVQGVAIMTDTDDTGEATTAFYGDIVFLPAHASKP